MPDAPLRAFELRVADLPRTTEAERLVVERIGQDIFRARLMDYWQGRCPLTGIADAASLRASHIIPWANCESDAERLDVHNGLLLSALWDAAFDRALVTFETKVSPSFRPVSASKRAPNSAGIPDFARADEHRRRLARHREQGRLGLIIMWARDGLT